MTPAKETSFARMPALDPLTRWQLVYSTLAITVAFLLLAWQPKDAKCELEIFRASVLPCFRVSSSRSS
jgi:hypothetical protein